MDHANAAQSAPNRPQTLNLNTGTYMLNAKTVAEVKTQGKLIIFGLPGTGEATRPSVERNLTNSASRSITGSVVEYRNGPTPTGPCRKAADVSMPMAQERVVQTRTFERNTRFVARPLNRPMVITISSACSEKVIQERASPLEEVVNPARSNVSESLPPSSASDVGLTSVDQSLIQNAIDCFRPSHHLLETSKFILGPEALYILLLDGTKPLHEKLQYQRLDRKGKPKQIPFPETQGEFANAVLSSIHTYATNGNGNNASPAVLVAVRLQDIESESRITSEEISDFLEGKPYHDFIKGEPILVNCSDPDDPGPAELHEAIYREGQLNEQQDLFGGSFPPKWQHLLDLLEEKKRSRTIDPLMTYPDFIEMIGRVGMNEQEVRDFISVHNALGYLQYFKVDPQPVVILDPQWFYQTLEEFIVASTAMTGLRRNVLARLDEYGTLSEQTIDDLLHANEKHRDLLVNIMLKIDILIRLPRADDGEVFYLMPSLLQPAADSTDILKAGCLLAPSLFFTLDTNTESNGYLPEAAFWRLISHLLNQSSFWKLHGKPKSDQVLFDLQHTPMVSVVVRKEIQALSLTAYVLPSSDGRKPYISKSDSATVLVRLKEDFEDVMKIILSQLLRDDTKLITCTRCKCNDVKEHTRPYIKLDCLLGKEVMCCVHDRRQDVTSHREWFPVQNETDFDSKESFLPISIQPDPSPLTKLQSGVYNVNPSYRDLFFIINNVQFTEKSLEKRPEAHYDSENICNLFKKLGFVNTPMNNLKAAKFKKEIEEIAKSDFSDVNSFFLCVLSHGGPGFVCGTDGKPVYIQKDIVDQFCGANCPGLLGTPKVFIFEACRGVNDYSAETNQQEDCYPHHDPPDDVLLIYPTWMGYRAYKGPTGSRLIRSFVQEVCRTAHSQHLDEILLDVKRSVQSKVKETPESLEQTPRYDSGFRYKFYFLPGYRQQKALPN